MSAHSRSFCCGDVRLVLVIGGQDFDRLAEHQNKPDIGQPKFREWADTGGMTKALSRGDTSISLTMSAAAKENKSPFFAIGAAGA